MGKRRSKKKSRSQHRNSNPQHRQAQQQPVPRHVDHQHVIHPTPKQAGINIKHEHKGVVAQVSGSNDWRGWVSAIVFAFLCVVFVILKVMLSLINE